MRYIMLIYSQEGDTASPEELSAVAAQHREVTATTVRVQNGKTFVTDGPFAETKEQLAGYYILDCENLDEAIAWAAKIPTGCGVGPGALRSVPSARLANLAFR